MDMKSVQSANTLYLENVLKDFNILEDGDGEEMRNSAQNRRRRASSGYAQRRARSMEWPRRSPMAAGRVNSTSEPPAPRFARVTAGDAWR